jgi:hypothetical protein
MQNTAEAPQIFFLIRHRYINLLSLHLSLPVVLAMQPFRDQDIDFGPVSSHSIMILSSSLCMHSNHAKIDESIISSCLSNYSGDSEIFILLKAHVFIVRRESMIIKRAKSISIYIQGLIRTHS